MEIPLLLPIKSGYLRIAFRVYFTIAFILIALFGNTCLSLLSQRSLKIGKPRPIALMTGWLSDMPLLAAIVGLPGGLWFGGSMIVCTILSHVSDLAVSGFVQTVNVATRCPFGTGLVIPTSFSEDGWWSVPPNNGAPYFAVA